MRKFCLVVAFSLLLFNGFAQSKKDSEFKVVGYYSLNAAMKADVHTVPFDKLTHVNLFFLNPDSSGNFKQDLSAIIPFVKAAHAKGVKVLPSIAGGGRHEYYHKLLKDENRARFINDLLLITLKYNFDGIDVDIEGEDIDENYEKFATGLARVLKPHKKLVTAAIAVFYKDVLTDAALAQYDFVNIMSYDHTGPWKPANPGPHSTFEHAVSDLEYFGQVRKIPRQKMVLGVGFYGYGFGPTTESKPTSMNYRQIVEKFPGAENSDQVTLSDGATMYYNGVQTIRQKTQLAKEKASGIMIWQLLGDSPSSHSLLRVINEEARR